MMVPFLLKAFQHTQELFVRQLESFLSTSQKLIVKTTSLIKDRQHTDSNSNISSSANDLITDQFDFLKRLSIGIVVNVLKFSD